MFQVEWVCKVPCCFEVFIISGIKRHNFAPYSKQQLVQIVTSRISDLGVFNNTAIEFIATKVASVSGDARRALSICSKAVDVAVQEYKNRDVSVITFVVT